MRSGGLGGVREIGQSEGECEGLSTPLRGWAILE